MRCNPSANAKITAADYLPALFGSCTRYKIQATSQTKKGNFFVSLIMGKNDNNVKKTLGEPAWDTLVARAADGSIDSQHMKDLSQQLHPNIGGKHFRRVNDEKVKCDDSELRHILSDWWDQELYKLNQEVALKKICEILRSQEVNLPSIAATLKPHSETNTLDTILGPITQMLEHEPDLALRIKEICESFKDPGSTAPKTPEEAYQCINFYFKEMRKNKSLLQNIEQLESDTMDSFQSSHVKKTCF